MKKELLIHFLSKAATVEERIAAGKALRKKFPRIRQGEYKKLSNRTDPVSILEAQAKTRLQDLVPIRYARMLTSPFAFLRGAAVSSYRWRMKQYAHTGNLELWYTTITENDLLKTLAPFQKETAKRIAAKIGRIKVAEASS